MNGMRRVALDTLHSKVTVVYMVGQEMGPGGIWTQLLKKESFHLTNMCHVEKHTRMNAETKGERSVRTQL
jgi:hypothetical protein